MKFQFIGDESGNNPEEIVAFGTKFLLDGPAVEVSDEKAVAKLSGNRCFRAVNGDAPAPDEKDALIAQLAGMGIKADRRKSVDALKAMIEAGNADND